MDLARQNMVAAYHELQEYRVKVNIIELIYSKNSDYEATHNFLDKFKESVNENTSNFIQLLQMALSERVNIFK